MIGQCVQIFIIRNFFYVRASQRWLLKKITQTNLVCLRIIFCKENFKKKKGHGFSVILTNNYIYIILMELYFLRAFKSTYIILI